MPSMKPSCLVAGFLSLLVAPAVFAADTHSASVDKAVRLSCPAGTVQKERKHSKGEDVFCARTKRQAGELVHHGPYVDFHANGQKQSEGQYQNGFRSGRWSFWDANGAKTGETDFERGDYHGTRVEYHPNGNKKLEQQWVRGKREGIVTAYAEDGRKVSESHFSANRSVKEQRFENGKPVADK